MHDVVVVGAGLAGLRTASLLAADGFDVVVLEARDRVGGRTKTTQVEGATIDLGAQWLGAGQPRLRALADELGVETFPTFHRGDKLVETAGRVSRYGGTIPALPVLSLLSLEATLRRTERALGPVAAGEPWASPSARDVDRISLGQWRAQTLPPGPGREVFDLAMRIVFGAEPEEVSLLYALNYAKSAGGLMPLVEVEDGAQQDRFVTGAASLSERLAAGLDVRLDTPVERIEQHADHVVVQGVEARFVVVAVPPPLARRIAWEPPRPAAREQLAQRSPMGATIKVFAFYETAFWRDQGLSGEAISDTEPACFAIDASQADGSHPALLSFLVGSSARRWGQETPEVRQAAVLEQLARWFGPAARSPIAVREKDWAQTPWSRGCPIAFMTPGTLTDFGPALRQPVGRVHFAGTETAREWCGFLEGALESAERVTDELRSRLADPTR